MGGLYMTGAWLLWDNHWTDGSVYDDDKDWPPQIHDSAAVPAWYWTNLLQRPRIQPGQRPSRL